MDVTPASAARATALAGEGATAHASHDAPRTAVLRMDGIDKRFGQFQALSDVSLELFAGEVHCLLGENGAGKSTLCNVVFGVHQPDAGSMWLDGAPYRPHSPRDALAHGIAMVHQHFSLVEDVSVLDNLLLGQVRGWLDRKREAQRVRALVADLGLALDPDARVADLSVGEKQRVELVGGDAGPDVLADHRQHVGREAAGDAQLGDVVGSLVGNGHEFGRGGSMMTNAQLYRGSPDGLREPG